MEGEAVPWGATGFETQVSEKSGRGSTPPPSANRRVIRVGLSELVLKTSNPLKGVWVRVPVLLQNKGE